MSTVETAVDRAAAYLAEVARTATLDELRELWTAAARAELGEVPFRLVAAAIMARKTALEDQDAAAMALLARELGAVPFGPRAVSA